LTHNALIFNYKCSESKIFEPSLSLELAANSLHESFQRV